jgi:hypothetical protein
MIGRGNRSTRRKPAPVPLCPPQTPHAAHTRTRAAEVGSQRLTAELRHGLGAFCLYMPSASNVMVATSRQCYSNCGPRTTDGMWRYIRWSVVHILLYDM